MNKERSIPTGFQIYLGIIRRSAGCDFHPKDSPNDVKKFQSHNIQLFVQKYFNYRAY